MAGLKDQPELLEETGLSIGTGSNATLDAAFHRLYAENKDRLAPMTLPRGMNNAAASEMLIRFGLKGPNNTCSVACASASSAIGEAMRAIRHGYVERILAGGSEALLTFGVLHAWYALRALAEPDADISASCRPFSSANEGVAKVKCPLSTNCTTAKPGRASKRHPEDEKRDALRFVMQQRQAQKISRKRKTMIEPVFNHLRVFLTRRIVAHDYRI
jgi:Beta-ketoacyl synthase, N-terminal domain